MATASAKKTAFDKPSGPPSQLKVPGRFRRYETFVGVGLLSGVLLWELLGRVLDLIYLPPFSSVFVRLVEMLTSSDVLTLLASSLRNLFIGFTAAVVIGVLVGILMARNRSVEIALDPYVYALLTAPSVVFVPVYFAIFALSPWAIIALIFQYAVFIIIVNTVSAVKTVDKEFLEMAQVFGATKERTLVRKVILRGASPHIFAGIRLGLGRAIKGMINGEILIAVVGIGGLSNKFGRAFDSEGMLALLLLVILVAFALDLITNLLDSKINSWLPSANRR